jgi:hypothetical protein
MDGGVDIYLHEFLTFTLDGGELLVSRCDRSTPREAAPVDTGQEAVWVPESVWTLSKGENILSVSGMKPWIVVQPIA